MAKQLIFNEEARKKMLSGVEQIAQAVKVTLGPCGRLGMLDKKFGAPTITKDGVSVAKEVELKDDELIGYINFMPVTDGAYKKFREGKLTEQNLTAKDVKILKPNKEYHCLFLSVVIDKKYQNTEAFTMLISNFYKNTKNYLQTHNIIIKSILADCVNKKMEQFVKNSGFKRVFKNENYNIYEGNIFSK